MSGSIVAASWLNFRRFVPPNDENPIASAIAGSISMSSMASVEDEFFEVWKGWGSRIQKVASRDCGAAAVAF